MRARHATYSGVCRARVVEGTVNRRRVSQAPSSGQIAKFPDKRVHLKARKRYHVDRSARVLRQRRFKNRRGARQETLREVGVRGCDWHVYSDE